MVAIALLYVVSAASFLQPSTGDTVSGQLTFNISCPGGNATSATIICTSSTNGLAVSTFSNSTVCVNTSVSSTTINCTVETRGTTDDNSYVCTGTCYNGTGSSESITSITIKVDNTNPICSMDTNVFKSSTTYSPDQEWKITGTNATKAYIKFGSNGPYQMDEKQTDIFTDTIQLPEATYNLVAYTTDGQQTTYCSELNSIRIDKEVMPIKVASAISGTGGAKAGQSNSNISLLVIIGIALVWYTRNKK